MLYCGMDAALRILGIAVVTACFLTVGTIGTRFFNTAPARARTSFAIVAGTSDTDTAMPLPPSSKRMYAIRQNDDPNAVITMYATPSLSPEQIAVFYLEEMPIYGWREGEAQEQQLNKYVEDIILFFRKTGSECVICIGSEGVGAAWTIVMRPVIIGGGR